MCAQTVRGGDFLDAHRNKRREGERVEVETVKGGGKGGGAQGTVPGNNDWALWRSGGEERTACFLTGSLIDRYGLLPAGCSQTERYRKKAWKVLSSERRMPPNYDSATRKDSVPKESHSKQP